MVIIEMPRGQKIGPFDTYDEAIEWIKTEGIPFRCAPRIRCITTPELWSRLCAETRVTVDSHGNFVPIPPKEG